MSKKHILLFAAAVAMAGLGPAQARTAPRHPVVAPVSDPLLTTYPRGGAGLVDAVEHRLESACQTAQGVIALAGAANPDQKAAIATAIVRAARKYQATSPELANCIQAAMSGADPTLMAMVSALQSQLYAQGQGGMTGDRSPFYPGGGSGFSGGLGGGRPVCVSCN